MKYLDGNCYVEVKGTRYKIHPTENITLSLGVEPKCVRTKYQVQSQTKIRKNQKVIKQNND